MAKKFKPRSAKGDLLAAQIKQLEKLIHDLKWSTIPAIELKLHDAQTSLQFYENRKEQLVEDLMYETKKDA